MVARALLGEGDRRRGRGGGGNGPRRRGVGREVTITSEGEAMTDRASVAAGGAVRTPAHLWFVGVLALLWNGIGAFDYLATRMKLDLYMSQFTEVELAYFYGFPAWAVAGWAFGVWGAVAGSVGLLVRRRWSPWAFAVSLAGMVVSSVYTLGMSDGAEVMGSGGLVFSAVIWLVAVLLLAYSWRQSARGVLR